MRGRWKNKGLLYLIILISTILVGLFLYSVTQVSDTMPEDFNIYYSYGVGEKNLLDTKNNLYVKDMIYDPSINFTVTLSKDEKQEIYNSIRENDFFSLKESEPKCEALPCSTTTLKLTA